MERTSRRHVLQMLAAAPLAVPFLGVGASVAAPARGKASIVRLIAQARAVPEDQASVAERLDFISRALIGVRYQADTLIGGPQQPERFVVRDDAFDCVTFCEFVLAAALARDYAEFETVLRTIRYSHGEIAWSDRNHYFAEWCRCAVEKNICARVAMPDTVTIDKTVNWGHVGRRQVSIAAVPPAAVLANGGLLNNGDVIGFVSRRPALDFFHTGLVIVDDDGVLILRHASQRRRRVADEPLTSFIAANTVEQVTLLRAIEPSARS